MSELPFIAAIIGLSSKEALAYLIDSERTKSADTAEKLSALGVRQSTLKVLSKRELESLHATVADLSYEPIASGNPERYRKRLAVADSAWFIYDIALSKPQWTEWLRRSSGNEIIAQAEYSQNELSGLEAAAARQLYMAHGIAFQYPEGVSHVDYLGPLERGERPFNSAYYAVKEAVGAELGYFADIKRKRGEGIVNIDFYDGDTYRGSYRGKHAGTSRVRLTGPYTIYRFEGQVSDQITIQQVRA